MFTIFFIISFASRCNFIDIYVLTSLLSPVSSEIFVRAHSSACVAAVLSLQFGLNFSDFSESYSSSWLSMNHNLSFVPGIYLCFHPFFLVSF